MSQLLQQRVKSSAYLIIYGEVLHVHLQESSKRFTIMRIW